MERLVYPGGRTSSPHSLHFSPARKSLGALVRFFLMPEPGALAFFFWLVAGSRIMETSLDLLPVTGVPSAAQRCLSSGRVRFISDSSVSAKASLGLSCCGLIRSAVAMAVVAVARAARADMFLTEMRPAHVFARNGCGVRARNGWCGVARNGCGAVCGADRGTARMVRHEGRELLAMGATGDGYASRRQTCRQGFICLGVVPAGTACKYSVTRSLLLLVGCWIEDEGDELGLVAEHPHSLADRKSVV